MKEERRRERNKINEEDASGKRKERRGLTQRTQSSDEKEAEK